MHGKGKYFNRDKQENPPPIDKNLSTIFINSLNINYQ